MRGLVAIRIVELRGGGQGRRDCSARWTPVCSSLSQDCREFESRRRGLCVDTVVMCFAEGVVAIKINELGRGVEAAGHKFSMKTATQWVSAMSLACGPVKIGGLHNATNVSSGKGKPRG